MKKSKFMLAALLGLYASTSLSSAAVTPKEPELVDGYYLIKEYAELVWFGNHVNKASYENDWAYSKAKLQNDIEVKSSDGKFTPMGTIDYPFEGAFYGNGFEIKGLKAEPTDEFGHVGFFYHINGSAKIDNLHITEAEYTDPQRGGRGSIAGGIVAIMENGTITRSSFSGNIKITGEEAMVGGICGQVEKGTIQYCYATDASLSAVYTASGIAGEIADGSITNCFVNVALTGEDKYPIAHSRGTKPKLNKNYYSAKVQNDAGATSDADFKSGKIAYLLNNGAETPFKQTIGTDAFPSFEGESVYQYTFCNEELRYSNNKEDQGEVLGHIFGDKHEAKEPTCTEKGNNAYWECKREPGVYYKNPNYGHYETYANASEVFIPALGHHMVEHKAEAAKCEKDGNLLYYTCEHESGVYYKDAKATKKTTLDAVTIPATGHQLEQHTLSAQTCTESGETNYVYYTCKNDPTEFFSKDGVTPIKDPQEAINDVVGHDWPDTWTFVKTEDNKDIFTRTCKRNPDHTETTYSPHAWSEWELVESEPDHDKYVHTCTSTYGSHSEDMTKKFSVEKVTYYSQKTGERDTTFRAETEFKAVDTKNDLLFASDTTTITGNNVVAGDVCKNLVITDEGVNGDMAGFSTTRTFTAENLSYTREDTARYLSFVLPYDVPMTSFIGDVYTFKEYIPSRKSVKFVKINDDIVEAGNPCILYNVTDAGTAHKIHADLEDVKIKNNVNARSIGNNQCFYFGTFSLQSGPSSDAKTYYGFVRNQFVRAGITYTLLPFRAAVKLESEPHASLGLLFDEDLTGVATIDAEGNLTTGNVDVYDMTGRLVRKNVESATCLQGLKPGVYVVNGEKFVKTANER